MRRAALVVMVGPLLTVAHAEPFLTRNQNPLLTLYGLPSPLPARLPPAGGGRVAGVINWGNTEKEDFPADGNYTLDAETFELRLHFDHALADRFAMHAELAWRKVSEGSLDGFIDDWHGVFGLPGGSRRRLPEDQLLIEFEQGGASLLRFDESTSGIGDIPVASATSCTPPSAPRSPLGSRSRHPRAVPTS